MPDDASGPLDGTGEPLDAAGLDARIVAARQAQASLPGLTSDLVRADGAVAAAQRTCVSTGTG